MLNDSEKKKVRESIEEKIRKTRQDIEELEEQTKPIAPENSLGRISRMDAINNRSVSEAALRQSRQRLVKLENALSSVDRPTFGQCARCGNPIPIGRLLLMPEIPLCIRCAQVR